MKKIKAVRAVKVERAECDTIDELHRLHNRPLLERFAVLDFNMYALFLNFVVFEKKIDLVELIILMSPARVSTTVHVSFRHSPSPFPFSFVYVVEPFLKTYIFVTFVRCR
jgi:hypothetical protein